jgi:hypothetical protein
MQYEYDKFRSKSDTKEYLENYDKIFGKKIPWYERLEKELEKEEKDVQDRGNPSSS